jgi:hypothetical protein
MKFPEALERIIRLMTIPRFSHLMALASFEALKLIISRFVINKQKKSDEDKKSVDRHDRISMMMEHPS